MSDFHLARYAELRPRRSFHQAGLADFTQARDRLHQSLRGSPGFLFLQPDSDGRSLSGQALLESPLIVHLSLWTTLDALRSCLRQDAQQSFLAHSKTWFEEAQRPDHVLWWLPAGMEPSLDDALERLIRLQRNGATPEAFTVDDPFGPPGSR